MREIITEKANPKGTIDYITLGQFLNSQDGLHIDEVYFTADGTWYFNQYSYRKKNYARLASKEEIFTGPDGVKYSKLANVAIEEMEIVKTMTAEEILAEMDKAIKKIK